MTFNCFQEFSTLGIQDQYITGLDKIGVFRDILAVATYKMSRCDLKYTTFNVFSSIVQINLKVLSNDATYFFVQKEWKIL